MNTLIPLLALFLGASAHADPAAARLATPAEKAVEAVGQALDDLHDAASKADGKRYFARYTDDAVFLGTDATERWTIAEFKAYAEKRFSAGKGWTYVPKSRHVTLSPRGDLAWFDESLENASYGECRGSGVLRRVKGYWRVAQYNLTVPIPNGLLDKVVAMIRAK